MPEKTERHGLVAVWLVIASIASVQIGASVAKQTFGVVTPICMAWLRLCGASAVLGIARAVQTRRARPGPDAEPRPRRNRRAIALYAATMVGMNVSIYEAFSRMPVGLAVTVEFLGPLTVGALGASRRRDLAWPVLAFMGVAMLGFTPSRPALAGVLFALVAATCWGLYIHAAEEVGHTWTPIDALLVACLAGAVVTTVPALVTNDLAVLTPHVLLVGLAVGALSTAIPYSLEIVALRTIPKGAFGILMSLEPVAAALSALVLLGEHLHLLDLVAMTCVVVASIGATRFT